MSRIAVNERVPGGARALHTFGEIGAFILTNLDVERRLTPHWTAVRQDLIQARFGARCAEVYQATRDALAAEGWLE